jgi:hypothetical protein
VVIEPAGGSAQGHAVFASDPPHGPKHSAVPAALVDELAEQAGMAGDDDAGSAFSRLYDAAVESAVDGIAHAMNLVGGGSRSTFRAAVTFMAKDAELADQLRDEGVIGADGAVDPQQTPLCDQSRVGLASGVPNIRGTTSIADRWVWGQRFRGSPDKLRTVATTWREAERITSRVLDEVQACWDLVRPARGKTADATNRFFLRLCGHGPCLARVDDQAALLANLPAACAQLAQACEHYADHIATAKSRIPEQSLTDPLTHPLEGIFGAPVFGGNGEDGGLYDANATDTAILGLADIPPALDHSRIRVPVPHPGDNIPWWEKIPLFGLPGITGPQQPGYPDPPEEPVPEVPGIPAVPEIPVLVVHRDAGRLPGPERGDRPKGAGARAGPTRAGLPTTHPGTAEELRRVGGETARKRLRRQPEPEQFGESGSAGRPSPPPPHPNRPASTSSRPRPKAVRQADRQGRRTIYQFCARGIEAGRNPNAQASRRPRCCALGRCRRKRLSPLTLAYIHSVLKSALAHGVREEEIPRERRTQCPHRHAPTPPHRSPHRRRGPPVPHRYRGAPARRAVRTRAAHGAAQGRAPRPALGRPRPRRAAPPPSAAPSSEPAAAA